MRWLVRLLVLAPLVAAWPAAGAPLEELRALALDLVNEARQEQGLATLTADPALHAAAQRHAEDMARKEYFGHKSPEGQTVFDRFIAAGGSQWLEVAENISHCRSCDSSFSPADVRRSQAGWMSSEEHRTNILHPEMEQFGFGIAVSADGNQYAVQTFAGPGMAPGDASALASYEPARPPLAEDQQARSLQMVNEARRRHDLAPLTASSALTEAARSLARQLVRSPASVTLESEQLYGSIPRDAQHLWREIAASVSTCGGCGTEAQPGDVAFFVDRWLSQGGESTLLERGFSHYGFGLAADGAGRKLAVALLGRQRPSAG